MNYYKNVPLYVDSSNSHPRKSPPAPRKKMLIQFVMFALNHVELDFSQLLPGASSYVRGF
ncbi:MAG: hypothetical protein DRI57_22535 [Deltaproteobacteria bacterium]|nr:MAG: hypothetical protein DRI57_22535 [Deltaproteobacteria bacterium]